MKWEMNDPFSSIFWKRLYKMSVIFSWNVWENAPAKPSVPRYFVSNGVFFLIMNLIPFLVIAIFRLSIYFLVYFIPSVLFLLPCLLTHFSVFNFNLSSVFLSTYLCIVMLVVTLGVYTFLSYQNLWPCFNILWLSGKCKNLTTFTYHIYPHLNIVCICIEKDIKQCYVLLSITKRTFKNSRE